MKAPKSRLADLARAGGLKKRSMAKKSALTTNTSSSHGMSASSATSESRERKRLKADSLAWKPVNTSNIVGIDDGGGMMMLEELDDVGVEWEENETGTKVARFVEAESSGKRKGKKRALEPISAEAEDEAEAGENVQVDAEAEASEADGEEDEAEGLPSFAALDQADMDEEDEAVLDEPAAFDDALLPAWTGVPLHPHIKRALLASGFVKPTDIQSRAIPVGLEGRDVVGVAETGSGKTLAYSLPILSHLLSSPRPSPSARRPLSALVLCPTRELALQVVDHLQRVVAHIEAAIDPEDEDEDDTVAVKSQSKSNPKGKGESTNKAKGKVPRISIGSVVGGLSAHKQKRIVERGADVLVATPGRLWDLIKSDDRLAADTRTLRFLIIDEADRMIENGHFAELESIVRLTQRQGSQTAGPDDDDPVFAETSTILSSSTPREDMQTFVFSATLSKDLQQNLKKRYKQGKKGVKRATALEDLVEKLDFRDAAPEVIDLSPEGGVVKQLKESMVECIVADKDLYLYYFLLRYPGRSIVFVGSIDGIRRLTPLFEMLQMPVWPLHSQLQQKQRLKNLDRFKSSKNGALIATDVAARGLDIPAVDHVIHFNLPRTADAYIHRSGRTARAQNPGFALQIVSPEDRAVQRGLMKSLGRSNELPELSIESGFLPKLKERIRIAREIDKAQHEAKKETHDRNWLIEAAEAMDIDLDPSIDDDIDGFAKGQQRKGKGKASTNLPSLKAQLKGLLAEPLLARGVSARYPTSGSKVIVDELIASSGHGTLLGANTAKAWDEVHKPGRKLKSAAKRKRPAA